LPRDNGVTTNGGDDLGSTTSRWRDLYLSGGVHLGGTGSANKLDDYEEGTWTPTFGAGTITYSGQSGRYTKVGNLVTVSFNLAWSARSGTGGVSITGLPFNISNTMTSYRGGGSLGTQAGLDTSGGKQVILGVDAGQTALHFRFINDNATWTSVAIQSCNAGGEVQGTASYIAA